MTIGYDNLEFNKHILLDLPFREGTGTVTQDVAKPHHPMTMVDPGGGSFVWTSLDTGKMVLQFNAIGGGGTDGVYINCVAASSTDLNFTTENYSVGCWFNWDSTGGQSELLIGRYSTQVDGWDMYLNISGGLNTLSQRHHHSSLGASNLKSECYSTGWTPGEWHFMGMSRTGLFTPHYRNGVALDMTYDDNGMLDPDTASRDLSIGTRGTTKDANWFRDLMSRPRVWGDIALTSDDWLLLYEMDKGWFT